MHCISPLQDGSLLLTTLTSQFVNATGLNYVYEATQCTRAVRCVIQSLTAPDGGWGTRRYNVIFNKGRHFVYTHTDRLTDIQAHPCVLYFFLLLISLIFFLLDYD